VVVVVVSMVVLRQPCNGDNHFCDSDDSGGVVVVDDVVVVVVVVLLVVLVMVVLVGVHMRPSISEQSSSAHLCRCEFRHFRFLGRISQHARCIVGCFNGGDVSSNRIVQASHECRVAHTCGFKLGCQVCDLALRLMTVGGGYEDVCVCVCVCVCVFVFVCA
jgi:hypothetical protein